jgi:hypothetical protein
MRDLFYHLPLQPLLTLSHLSLSDDQKDIRDREIVCSVLWVYVCVCVSSSPSFNSFYSLFFLSLSMHLSLSFPLSCLRERHRKIKKWLVCMPVCLFPLSGKGGKGRTGSKSKRRKRNEYKNRICQLVGAASIHTRYFCATREVIFKLSSTLPLGAARIGLMRNALRVCVD